MESANVAPHAIAEFEKDITREMVIAMLNKAKSKGNRLGRPPITTYLSTRQKRCSQRAFHIKRLKKKLSLREGTIRKRLNRVTIN